MAEATIFEISSSGRRGVKFPRSDVPDYDLPMEFTRKELPLPEVSELDVIRHFTRLSKLNYSIDSGFISFRFCVP